MIRYRDVEHNDIVDIINLTRQYGDPAVIDGYRVDYKEWIKACVGYIEQADAKNAVFKVAYDDEALLGFIIGVAGQWHYSTDLYLDLIEVITEEAMQPFEKAEITMELIRLCEEEARKAGLKGLSVYSVRDTSRAYANFFQKRLGWTPLHGAKKIF